MLAYLSVWRSEALQSSRLLLRALEPANLNATYLGWLNDPAMNLNLKTRFLPQTLEALQAYWQAHRDDHANPCLAICLGGDGRHIGNIKLRAIHWFLRREDLSLIIGDSSWWGQGFASETIALVRDWAFRPLTLRKHNAGNIDIHRAFEKCGFEFGRALRQEVVSAGERLDVWRLGLLHSSHWSPVS
ncbi:GNAT family N-acetyltransferase [Synechococcus sp. AH-736-M20]|nr:GNAT family N-acetyltransferase [Synechococcus sp. AH-736-M20]